MALKIGMIFPDYASQFVGMAKELYDNSRLIQEYFEEASNCLNINFVKLCFASSDSELVKMSYAYPSLFLVSSAISALLRERGIVPYKVAGYSLGEYAALCSIGSITLPDGLYFLSKFAALYQDELNGLDVRTIKVKGLLTKKLKKLLETSGNKNSQIVISSYQADNIHTIVGVRNAINAVELSILKINNVEVEDIPSEAGLHSLFMTPVSSALKMYSEKIDINNTNISFITGVDGLPIYLGASIKEKLIQQIYSPLLWKNVMKDMHDCDIFIHIGPGNTLAYITSIFYPKKLLFVINKQSDLDKLIQYLD